MTRRGGGSYRRPPRTYPASVCEDCLRRIADDTNSYAQSRDGYPVTEAIRLLSEIDGATTFQSTMLAIQGRRRSPSTMPSSALLRLRRDIESSSDAPSVISEWLSGKHWRGDRPAVVTHATRVLLKLRPLEES